MTEYTACSVEECERQVKARGYCQGHYDHARRTGTIVARYTRLPKGGVACAIEDCNACVYSRGLCRAHWKMARPACGVDGCDKPRGYGIAGLCNMHQERLRYKGDVGSPLPAKAPNGSGCVDLTNGYVRVSVPGSRGWRIRHEHCLVMEEVLGRPLHDGETVHHKNGVRADNRPDNLELWSQAHSRGQRVVDLVEFVCRWYPELVVGTAKAMGLVDVK